MSATEKIVSILAILFGVFILCTDDAEVIGRIFQIIVGFLKGLLGF